MEFCLFVAEKDFNKKKLKRILDRLSYGIKKRGDRDRVFHNCV